MTHADITELDHLIELLRDTKRGRTDKEKVFKLLLPRLELIREHFAFLVSERERLLTEIIDQNHVRKTKD